jgi:2-polyprenyl-3-methyl-5-hydroxy-6-metoxy-1,4-benzoquinol methylase
MGVQKEKADGFLGRCGRAAAWPRHTDRMEPEPGSLAEYFDGWYADMTDAPVKDDIQQRHLGLPPRLLSTSLLSWDGIAEATAALRLSPGRRLVDLACGRGGYGLEIAARTGVRLVGIDFSAEAVRQAREHAGRLGAMADLVRRVIATATAP